MRLKTTMYLFGGLILALGAASLYTVDARELVVVLSFGAPVRTVSDAGLHVRWPWPVNEVVRLDRRARVLTVSPSELLTKDKKNLVVEAFAVWQVSEPQKFIEAFRKPGSEGLRWEELLESAAIRLSDLVTSRIASALGHKEFNEFLSVESQGTAMLPDEVATDVASTAADRFGIHVLDVRLRHLGLPLQNEQSIYERMRAERLRIANAYRSEGEEQATTIKAKADRQAAEILADAERESAEILASAEEAAARLYAQTYKQDPSFYGFVQRLDSARAILTGTGPMDSAGATGSDATTRTVVVLDDKSELFRALLGKDQPGSAQ